MRDPVEAARGAAVLVVGTEWPEYQKIPGDMVAEVAPEVVVLDPNRFLPAFQTTRRLHYVAVGTPFSRVNGPA